MPSPRWREDPFDVVVVGGGITGAGVALDAASRGYSVALVEKSDFAAGTSSRSCKLVHGGLRYLQKFDLGLVREALLERQLMVDARAAPGAAAAARRRRLRGQAPRPAVGLGLNMYDVMSRELAAAPAARRQPDGEDDWSPDRHRTIDGDEVVRLMPALAAREPTSRLPLLRLPDRRRRDSCSRCWARPSASARCAPTAARSTSLVEEGGRAAGVRVRDGATGDEFSRPRPERRQRHGGVGRPAAPRGAARRGRGAADPPEPRHPHHARRARRCRCTAPGAIVPAGGGRTIFVLPWLGRALVGTTDNDYEGDLEHVRPRRATTWTTCSHAVNEFFGTSLGRGRPQPAPTPACGR